jgi:hypothetical protein
MFGAVRVLLSVVALPPYASILVSVHHVKYSPLFTPPREVGLLFVLHFHARNVEPLRFERRVV